MSTPSDLALRKQSLRSGFGEIEPLDGSLSSSTSDSEIRSESGLLDRLHKEDIDDLQSNLLGNQPNGLPNRQNPGVKHLRMLRDGTSQSPSDLQHSGGQSTPTSIGRPKLRINVDNPTQLSVKLKNPRIRFENPQTLVSRPEIDGDELAPNNIAPNRSGSLRGRVEVVPPDSSGKGVKLAANVAVGGIGGIVLGAIAAGAIGGLGGTGDRHRDRRGGRPGRGSAVWGLSRQQTEYRLPRHPSRLPDRRQTHAAQQLVLDTACAARKESARRDTGAPGFTVLGRMKNSVRCSSTPSRKKNDFGTQATPLQARQYLRYAVAMKTAYSGNRTHYTYRPTPIRATWRTTASSIAPICATPGPLPSKKSAGSSKTTRMSRNRRNHRRAAG